MIDYAMLRGTLAERKVTQDSLADRLGCSRQSINNKITGKSPFTLRDVTVICEAIDATADERDRIFFAADVKQE